MAECAGTAPRPVQGRSRVLGLLPQRLFDAAPGRFGLWWVVDRFELWCYQLRCTSS